MFLSLKLALFLSYTRSLDLEVIRQSKVHTRFKVNVPFKSPVGYTFVFGGRGGGSKTEKLGLLIVFPEQPI